MSIERLHPGPRMSQAVIHGTTVYTSGQVAQNAKGGSVADQTRDILTRIDALLAEAGTDKHHLLSVNIWLAHMTSFAEMNAVYDAWVSADNPPCRACVEARLATADFGVEIAVIAARD